MSAKSKFLGELRGLLRKAPSGEVDDLIEYYDELISERIAGGEKEGKVVHDLGEPKEIAAGFKRDVAINRAVKRPTLSNGIKVLIAILGVLSLPLLVPVAAVMVALIAAGIALLAACCAAFLGISVGAVMSVIDMARVVHSGDAPFYLLVLVTGGALIVVTLVFELLRGTIKLVRWSVRKFISKIKARHDRNKEEQ
jgi:uncharacterized membrane protein